MMAWPIGLGRPANPFGGLTKLPASVRILPLSKERRLQEKCVYLSVVVLDKPILGLN